MNQNACRVENNLCAAHGGYESVVQVSKNTEAPAVQRYQYFHNEPGKNTSADEVLYVDDVAVEQETLSYLQRKTPTEWIQHSAYSIGNSACGVHEIIE